LNRTDLRRSCLKSRL